ncbi:MAG: signal peptidase I [Clostridia bacterium]|nr:signal peptidase I [Clostridia bacterium]
MQSETKQKKQAFSAGIFELLGTLLPALIVIILAMTFIFRQVVVNGESMEQTFYDGERLIMSVSYDTMPSNNDVVVISHAKEYDSQIIKRVIATEGQSLSIDFEKNQVVVDGVILDEPYITGRTIQTDKNMEIPSVIPEGYVFVMGDNREASLDSRSTQIGLIPVTSIIGKVQMRIMPFDRFTIF